MRRTSHVAFTVAVGALLCGACARAAPVLSAYDLRCLVVMEDRPVAPIAVEQLEWCGGAGLVVSGWARWPDRPALVAFEAGQVPELLRPVHFFPRFVLSPDGRGLTCWHRLGEEMGAQAQLTTVDLLAGTVANLGSPQRFLSAGKLVWAAPGVVIAACQSEGGGTVLYRAEGDQCRVLARLEGLICDDLVAEDDGEHVLVVCAGQPPRHLRINWRAGVWAEVEPSLYAAPRPHALPAGVSLDLAAGRLIRTVGLDERVVLAEAVEAACGRDGGGAIIYATGGDLYVTDAAGEINRRLWGAAGEPDARADRLYWSPDGSVVAHCYRSGDAGVVRRAALGTETVTVTLTFGAGSSVKPGDAVWVAERFRHTAAGAVAEPVWSTLKALLRVEQVSPTDAGTLVSAVSEGVEGGVVERLTGSNDPPAGSAGAGHISIGSGAQPPAAWMQTFTAPPRPNLAAWAQGDAVLGRLQTVVVTRRRLMPATP